MDESPKPDRQERVFDLLIEAEALRGAERDALLAASDPSIAREVRHLLAEFGGGQADNFLPTRGRVGPRAEAVEAESAPFPGEALGPGTQIGRYRLVEPLGAGGMGQVFLADQVEPVRRQVAIKLLRFRVVLPELRERFTREQRAMEQLDHPNVGKILDAGTTADGEPYMVMELIHGVPLTIYCDEHGLGIDERLRLFLDVCRGVGHAHRRLLLHRDLKPSNILVAEVDGRPMAKLIDFGIAKALDASVETGLSGTGVVGTPPYMSPEALLGDSLDTRTDVFSLGVVLHSLMVGRLPWVDPPDAFADQLKRRFERRSRSPSEDLAELEAENAATTARRRGETANGLARRLDGDLDAIVAKAIANDREARYGSIDELVADIERHLADEPIQARPLTAVYLLRKATRRHRTAVTAAAVVLMTLALGIVGTSIGFWQARDQAQAAITARDQAEQVSDFMVGLFRAARPGERTAQLTAREIVDRGAESLETRLADQPERRVLLQRTLGEIYAEWTLYEDAEARLDAARRGGGSNVGEADLRGLRELAAVWSDQGRFTEATELASRAMAESPNEREQALSLDVLASVRQQAGDLDGAEQAARRSLDLRRSMSRTPPEELARSVFALGSLLLRAERLDDALPLLEEALPLTETAHGDADHRTGAVLVHLSMAYLGLGRVDDAQATIGRALAVHDQQIESQRRDEDLRRLRRLELRQLAADGR